LLFKRQMAWYDGGFAVCLVRCLSPHAPPCTRLICARCWANAPRALGMVGWSWGGHGGPVWARAVSRLPIACHCGAAAEQLRAEGSYSRKAGAVYGGGHLAVMEARHAGGGGSAITGPGPATGPAGRPPPTAATTYGRGNHQLLVAVGTAAKQCHWLAVPPHWARAAPRSTAPTPVPRSAHQHHQ
jgi:hypothetical protein